MRPYRLIPLVLLSLGSEAFELQIRNVTNSSLPLNFQPRHFFQAVTDKCKAFAEHLEACPADLLHSAKDRFDTAQLFAECIAKQYGDNFACSEPFRNLKILPVEAFPAMYNTKANNTRAWDSAPFPAFPVNKTCNQPGIVPIMEKSCQFDYNTIENSTCCRNGTGKANDTPCGKESFNLLACSIQSLHTYVGCTARGAKDIEGCVVGTALRINYVPIGFQINSNGNDCPSPNRTIFHLASVSIGEFLAFFIASNPRYWGRLWRSRRDKTVQVRTTDFHVSVIGFWVSVAKEICQEIVIVGLILSRQGYKIDLMKNFVIFAIRPRPAFFSALLGYVDGGWAHDGLVEMVMQILLSIFGGYLSLFGAISANHTADPARPGFWKAYMAGGIMASITTDFVWIYFSLICNALVLICCGQWKPVAYLCFPPARLLWFTLTSPLKQLGIIMRNSYVLVARRGERSQDPDMLLDMGEWRLGLWYKLAMLVSLILFVGSWMFWVGFLRLSGELYCPQDLPSIDVAIIGLSFAIAILRKILGFLSGERNQNGWVSDPFELK